MYCILNAADHENIIEVISNESTHKINQKARLNALHKFINKNAATNVDNKGTRGHDNIKLPTEWKA